MSFYCVVASLMLYFFFFFNDTATTEIYTLSLHDALPIFMHIVEENGKALKVGEMDVFVGRNYVLSVRQRAEKGFQDRKSTRLNSSHLVISYAVFCLKKKKKW